MEKPMQGQQKTNHRLVFLRLVGLEEERVKGTADGDGRRTKKCYRKEGSSRNSRKGRRPEAPGISGGSMQDVSLIGHREEARGASKYMH